MRPFCDQSVNADLMRLTISSIDFDGLNSNSSIDIWCAVVPDLHDDFILTADAVYRLSQSDANLHVYQRVVTVIVMMISITILLLLL